MMRLLLVLLALVAAAAAQCKYGGQQRNGFCYHLSEEKRTYWDAESDCIQRRVFMAEPWSSEENKAIKSLLQDTKEDVWIGPYRSGRSRWKSSITWDALSFTDWISPEAPLRDNGKYGFLSYDNGFKWDAGSRTDEKLFMCQSCPETKWCCGDSCYFLACYNSKVEMDSVCTENGAYPAEINSDEEKKAISTFLSQFPSSFKVGLGARYDGGDTRWRWSQAKTTSDIGDVTWPATIPSSVRNLFEDGDMCLQLKNGNDASFGYVADRCFQVMHYLCEEPNKAAQQAPTKATCGAV